MTKTEFFALLERYLKRNDLADLYQDFLDQAIARLNADMRLLEQERVTSITPTTAATSLPSDYLEMRSVTANLARGPRVLEYVTPDQAAQYRRRLSNTGGYTFHTIVNNNIELIPHPTSESETVVDLTYFAKVDEFGAQVQADSVITNYPNLYLYATLYEAALMREAPQGAQIWLDAYQRLVADLNLSAEQGRFGNNAQMRAV